MNFFEVTENAVRYRYDGELLTISTWGKNSLRVQSSMMDKIPEGEAALIQVPDTKEVKITLLDERHAVIQNGLICAELYVQEWGNVLQISFLNEKGEVILREVSNGGALARRPRKFQPLQGESYRLKASFEASASEKIYGMGQYQQEILNLKGCNLELSHRNSQAAFHFIFQV